MIRQKLNQLIARGIVAWVKWANPDMFDRVRKARHRQPVIHPCSSFETKYLPPPDWHVHTKPIPGSGGFVVTVRNRKGDLEYSGCGCPQCYETWARATL